ncbi:Planctomycete cytochrome C [Thalassoglobus neptunius]|uniref:Planctomycete cytochrome C n=1 Tax=Thalassoglobus neptunius TaxID=1938619 RepID=A0A5C5VPT3_9PLAN|nr:PSD1 and planctomycete cytochrome C domain-containing protein [Thalassoglobus neptunius]TWT39811.1 Planctomycete cytochrome C [Thalassoglobus neptunius]
MKSLSLPVAVLFLIASNADADDHDVRFNRDVRPILTDKCFACHGPDAKEVQGGLRLDLRDQAIDVGAITPGETSKSELIHRVFSDEPLEVMPPVEANKPLSERERSVLRQWITEGAIYEPHWAYTRLRRPENSHEPGESLIDRFIDRRLHQTDFEPTRQADPITLLRRISFDLTGLPPTPDEVDAFLDDHSETAYAQLIDRLLESPRFGERMAIYWLDLVRYADTVGYHGDQDISQSPYRDYVIEAFNSNMSYDRFVREQLAGDLLPNPTTDQLIASGYNRLNQTTEEGGSQSKEYLAIYFADRVRNVSQVFMSATLGCAQCHDHKFDPFTARDFYSFGAFFADLDEVGVYGGRGHRPPVLHLPTPMQRVRMEELTSQIEQFQSQIPTLTDELLEVQDDWELSKISNLNQKEQSEFVWIDDEQEAGRTNSGTWNFVESDEAPVFSGEASRRQSRTGLVQHYFSKAEKSVTIEPTTKFYAWVFLDSENPPTALMVQLNDGDWDHRAVWGSDDIRFGRKEVDWDGYRRQGALPEAGNWIRLEIAARDVGLEKGTTVNGMAFVQFGGLVYWDKSGWMTDAGIPTHIASALQVPQVDRTEDQANEVEEYYLGNATRMVALRKLIQDAKDQRSQIEESSTTTVVSKSVEPRTVRVLPRGNWMDDSGDIVSPAIPEFLGQLQTGGRRATRLDLANWLCEPDNAMTSRTMVNRLWYLMFGRGISSSVDDFGGQGTFPSHPELLDWLAVEFVDSGWDIKHILKTIALTQAYQRSSKPTPQLLESDPNNELIARQGRFRLPAEMVRDTALMTSGLLNEKVGGPSVKPYQPEGYYAQLNFPRRIYEPDSGDNQYRRGVYTHWQRTFLHPMMKAFDAPSREECTAQRARSNTPLQALTLLNDPSFVEAACALAVRTMTEAGPESNNQMEWMYRVVTSRLPEQSIIEILQDVHQKHFEYFQRNPDHVRELLTAHAANNVADLDQVKLAAWTSVARVILNLNETITRY